MSYFDYTIASAFAAGLTIVPTAIYGGLVVIKTVINFMFYLSPSWAHYFIHFW